jgi:rubredoxin
MSASMFVINTSAPEALANDGTVRQLQTSIEASSPFTPKSWLCPQCSKRNPFESKHCIWKSCTQELTRTSTLLDQRGRSLEPARFPVYWICSTCYLTHYLLEILLRKPTCTCGQPTLQAIYDQFGDLFLFWQHDPDIQDLKNPAKVEEAARRLWAAGGHRWVDEMPINRLQESGAKVVEEMPML